MDPDRWKRIQDIYLAVVDLPGSAREAALEALSPHDDALRREVESLVAADGAADPLLDASLDDLFRLVEDDPWLRS